MSSRSSWPYLAHLPVVAWVFAGALFQGQVFFFRDVSVHYYPNYVFLERSLGQGVWPLWNPTSDAGAPFLMTDPVDLLLVGLLGAERALRFGSALHLAIAMAGASRLAAVLGMGRWGVWSAGLFYGLSGYVLSTANLLQLFHAAAWAPWVLAAALRLWEAPHPRRIAALALLGAVQACTLGAEIVLQTALFGVVLIARGLDRRRLSSLAGAGLMAACLAAPALLGVRALVEGTPRAGGLPPDQSFAFSLRPMVLLDAVLPKFFGDVHTFSEQGYWGQPFFPSGFPYLLSLYCGPGMLWLAWRSRGAPFRKRLVVLCGLGVVLSLGSHGPFAGLLEPLMRYFRTPAKFLFMSDLAVCLLAAWGLERATRGESRPKALAVVPAMVLLAVPLLLRSWPDLPGRLLGGWVPEMQDPRARFVIATAWPGALGVTGVLLLGAVLAARSRALAPLAGLLVGLDLLLVNGSVNPTTAPHFYALRPEVATLVDGTRAEGAFRWFAYGAGNVPALRWSKDVARLNSDVWLYYVDRQALLPRAHVLDGLEGAFDEERAGWEPRDSTLPARERLPERYRQHHARLRLANVRYVLSFRPLPEDLVRLRGRATLPEIEEPLCLYELKDPLPRAFRVKSALIVPDEALRHRTEAPDFDPRATVSWTWLPGRASPLPWRKDPTSTWGRSPMSAPIPTPCGFGWRVGPASSWSPRATTGTGRSRSPGRSGASCERTADTGRSGATGVARCSPSGIGPPGEPRPCWPVPWDSSAQPRWQAYPPPLHPVARGSSTSRRRTPGRRGPCPRKRRAEVRGRRSVGSLLAC